MGSSAQVGRRAGLLGLLTFLLTSAVAWANCADDRVDLRGDWGQARFSVELADDPETRSRGLMFRENLPLSAGMLFAYERPQRVAFWMRNTPIALDMIFADETGVVQRIQENAVPFDETSIEGGDGIQYVLEINGGLAARMGIEVGSEMRHPSIGDMAVWACE